MSFHNLNIDYVALATLFQKQRTFVADVGTMNAIVMNVSSALGINPDLLFELLRLEVGFPKHGELYRARMRGGANNHYVGVTQAGRLFWIDVQTFRPALGLPPDRENATLEMQVAAPFIYADRYRDVMIKQNYPLEAPFVYALHQQGVGAARSGFANIAGKQSAESLKVVKVAQRYAQQNRVQGGPRL